MLSQIITPHASLLLAVLASVCLLPGRLSAETYNGNPEPEASVCEAGRRYVFSWNLTDTCALEPRGGTSRGTKVTLDNEPSEAWQVLQAAKLSKFERDRRAILAMAGGYRASFEFLETVGFAADFSPARPYQSWGTEVIYVIADEGDFISLQHIMVMFVQKGDDVVGPMVMKHWRQDWQFEDRQILQYQGGESWAHRKYPKKTVAGTWSQSVYQVDDSPRYASFGTWRHNNSFSAWESDITWRPLPRREHSVRDDYQVLEGINRHIILPTGWVQEEENLKLKLDENLDPDGYLAKEIGHNRYQRLKNFDFSAGDEYWRRTGPYWELVRQRWQKLIAQKPQFALRTHRDGVPLFSVLFQFADSFAEGELSPEEAATKIDTLLTRHWHSG